MRSSLPLSPETVGRYLTPGEILCYYCGSAADTIDHVVPRVVLAQIEALGDADVTAQMRDRHRVLTVDACRECNGLAGAKYFDTLAQRKAFIKERLRHRYRRYLSLPDWTDSELDGLSSRLQMRVIASLEVKAILRRRLAA